MWFVQRSLYNLSLQAHSFDTDVIDEGWITYHSLAGTTGLKENGLPTYNTGDQKISLIPGLTALQLSTLRLLPSGLQYIPRL